MCREIGSVAHMQLTWRNDLQQVRTSQQRQLLRLPLYVVAAWCKCAKLKLFMSRSWKWWGWNQLADDILIKIAPYVRNDECAAMWLTAWSWPTGNQNVFVYSESHNRSSITQHSFWSKRRAAGQCCQEGVKSPIWLTFSPSRGPSFLLGGLRVFLRAFQKLRVF